MITLSEFEIVQEYRLAKHKAHQITILSQLTMLPKDMIYDILERNGIKVRRTKRTSTAWTPERIEQLRSFISEGMNAREIGERLGISEHAVKDARHRFVIEKSHSRESD